MSITDEELLELYQRYAHVIYHRALQLMKNEEDARDVVQETFARVIRNADSFRQQSSPLTWMYRISTNHCLNLIRNRSGRRDKLVHYGHEQQRDTGEQGESRFDHQVLMKLLEECDEQTRQVVIHTYFDDCTRKQVADLVGISVPTVRKRLNTFLDMARRNLVAASAVLLAILPLLSPWSMP